MWRSVQEQLVMLREQYAAAADAMAPVRRSNTELLGFTLRKIQHDAILAMSDSSPLTRYISYALGVLALVVVADLVQSRRKSLQRLGLPVVRPPKGVHQFDYKAILDEGARRHPDSPYLINYSGFESVVFPHSMWNEIKRVPPSKASAMYYFTHVLLGGWRLLGTDTSAIHKSIGVDLTRAVPVRVQAHQESARRACESSLGCSPEWKSFPMYWTLQAIVARANAAGLVGPELGNDPRWLRAVQAFPMAMVFGIYFSSLPPRIFRPLVTLVVFLPAWILYWYQRMLLRPMVHHDVLEYEKKSGEEERRELLQAAPSKKFPMTAWLLSRYEDQERTPQQVAHDFIVASFESTPSTSMSFYLIMSELVTRPELVDELRDEMMEVMVDGQLPQSNLSELRKLDSFMRECARCNPFGYMALFRRLREPVKLSNCPELPAGTVLCVDVHQVPWSKKLWENPSEFDPWRFLKLRELPGREQRHQYTSLGSDTPGWGDGPQACPGRVFAGNTIKVTLVNLIMNYEFRLPEKAEKPQRFTMPNGSSRPDMQARIMFRQRKKEKTTDLGDCYAE
ncbi:cytochrome P450 [Xylariaceae sp. FL0804]|nr:cytochrome P450 [Xylariaceae sp. FL0804]